MISVDDAKNIVIANTCRLPATVLSIKNAAGFVLAKDVYAQADMPPFHQSAMDGYAFAFAGFLQSNTIEIANEIAAGDGRDIKLLRNQAARIFTGAPMPANADTVVMQEKVLVQQNGLIINDALLQQGSNVRAKGSEITKGALAVKAETFLSAAAIGFLAGIGCSEVTVYQKPRVAIVVTGNELQQPGQPLLPGQVYQSNSFALAAALQQLQIVEPKILFAIDDLLDVQLKIEEAIQYADMVLITGGVSVGKYDFVLPATQACGITQLFYKVAQKPGKPLYFGRKENKIVFGLPGNPASVLTCFYQYVAMAIQQLTGNYQLVKTDRRSLAASYTKKPGLTHFLKGYCTSETAMPLAGQESYKLSSFATANCFILLPAQEENFELGQQVSVQLIG